MDDVDRQDGSLVEAVARHIDAHSMIPARATVVVAVSGGMDSVALLAMLGQLASQPGRDWRLIVAHLNHGLRPEADADEKFVATLAEEHGCPFVVEHCDVRACASRDGRGIEETARTLRYEFLQRLAAQRGACVVAVGHHADDNVETVLHRICRGTHLRGVAGMAPSRPLGRSEIHLVRPLLKCRRSEIEAFCRSRRLTWRTDASNADRQYRRNRIRHDLLPLIRRTLNERADEALLRLAAAAGEVDEYLTETAERVLSAAQRPGRQGRFALERASLASQPPLIRKVVMRCVLERLSVPLRSIDSKRYEELAMLFDSAGPSAVALPGRFIARREGDCVIVGERETPPPDFSTIQLACPGCNALGDGREIELEAFEFNENDFAAHCRKHDAGVELVDADCLAGSLTCRPRMDGDRFHPLGCEGSQTVSDFLTNAKLPPGRRAEVCCICDDRGVVYLAGLRIDERIKVTGRTRRVVRIRLMGFGLDKK